MRSVIPLLALAVAMSATPARADPEVGDLFDTPPGQQFRGWELRAGALAPDHTPYAVFARGNVYLIALTTPIATNAKGGITAEKITKIERVSARPGEEYINGMGCSIVGVMPAVAFYSKATGIARAFFVSRDDIREVRWFPPKDEPCQYSGP